MTNTICIFAALTTALTAGLFFAWTSSIVPGLGKLSDANYLAAMQSINREIQNPAFFACFIGAALLLPLAAILSYGTPINPRFWLLLGAATVYIVGVFGVTIAGNVPLNNALDRVSLQSANIDDLAHYRMSFEKAWNSFNFIRTVAGIISLLLVICALVTDLKNVESMLFNR